jgi:hypothetical protein
MKRHADGRFRGNRAPIENTNKIEIARWVERETLRLKKMGVSSFETIADLLTRCGRGQHVPTVVPPDGAAFPPDYSISRMGCWKAYRRRMEKEPSLEAREHRKMDTERLEDLYLSLQPGIKKGDAKAIEAGVRVLTLKAKVLGYASPQKLELTGTAGAPIPVALVQAMIERVDRESKEE